MFWQGLQIFLATCRWSLGGNLDLKNEVDPPVQDSLQVFPSPYANLSNRGTSSTHHNSPDLTTGQPNIKLLLCYSTELQGKHAGAYSCQAQFEPFYALRLRHQDRHSCKGV